LLPGARKAGIARHVDLRADPVQSLLMTHHLDMSPPRPSAKVGRVLSGRAGGGMGWRARHAKSFATLAAAALLDRRMPPGHRHPSKKLLGDCPPAKLAKTNTLTDAFTRRASVAVCFYGGACYRPKPRGRLAQR